MSNPYISLLSTAWKYARNERKRYVLIYSMFFVANVVAAMHPLLYGWFIDGLQRQGVEIIPYVWMYAGSFLGLRLLEWCFHGPARVMERQLAFNVSQNFLNELYHQILHLPVGWHQDHHSGATINRVKKAYESLRDFFQNGFTYLHAMGKFVFSFSAMLYFSPLFGLIGVVLGAFTVWVIFKFNQPFVKSLKETNEREHEMSSNLFDSLSNIITVITLRLEKRLQASFGEKVANILPPFRRTIRVNELKWFIAQMLVALIYVIITLGYVYQNYKPGETFYLAGLVMLLGYVGQFTSVFNDIALQYTQIVQHNTNVQTAQFISEAYEQQHRPEESAAFPVDWQRIDIRHLNFFRKQAGGVKQQAPGLYDIHMRIQRGERIALIGESGSGKSTLLALLRGLYQPHPFVQVQIDDQTKVDFRSITDNVTLFPQEPEIFENTIFYNITLGLPFSKEEVMEVCEAAHFADVVKQLPNGLDSTIQEKGVNLSGGQKQRLALARGILAARASDIVLLDEPTSSVDPRTEMMIYKKLFHTFSDKAVISSLHRLHLLTMFDYVYVLRNGQIVEEGTFDYLRKNGPIFGGLWQHQEEKVAV